MIEGALDVFDSLLDGRARRGCWRVFLDHKQNVFDAVDRRQYDRISSKATTQYQLFENCRNTPQISDMTALLSAVEPDETLGRRGPMWSFGMYWTAATRSHAAAVVEEWRRRGVEQSDIVVLATDETVADRYCRWWPRDAPPIHPRLDGAPLDAVRLATAAEFKGLEAVAAVVVGARELANGTHSARCT